MVFLMFIAYLSISYSYVANIDLFSNILLYNPNKNLQNPIFFQNPPSSSLFPSSFLLFILPPFVLSFSPFVSRELGSVQLGCIAFPSFPLLQTKSLQASSTFRCAYRLLSYIYIRNSDCYPFFIFQPFLYFKLNLCDCSICLGSSASSSSSLVMRPCSITIS